MPINKEEEIRKTKEDIAIIQHKLDKLEAKKLSEMLLMRQGVCDFVNYDNNRYLRIEFTDSFSGVNFWYKVNGFTLIRLMSPGPYNKLEEIYQQQVIKQKEEYPYKTQSPKSEELDPLIEEMVQNPPDFLKFQLNQDGIRL